MGFVFRRRIKLNNGWGLNLSKSGVSPSVRTKYGSIGTNGFSIRTGILGLSYRQRWNSNYGWLFIVFFLVFTFALEVIKFLFTLPIYLFQVLALLFEIIKWIALTSLDLFNYLFKNNSLGSLAKKKTVSIDQRISVDNKSLEYTNPTQSLIIKDNDNKMPDPFFSYSDFLLIEDYASKIYVQYESFRADRELQEKVLKHLKLDNKDIFSYLIMSDVSRILELCNPKFTETRNLETLSVIYLYSKMADAETFFEFEFFKTAFVTAEGKYNAAALDLINTIKELGDSVYADRVLTFPYLLKRFKHSGLKKYATAVYDFASLIIKLDYEITKIEEKTLRTIKEMLFDPYAEPEYIISDTVQSESEKNDVDFQVLTSTDRNDHEATLEDLQSELNKLIGLREVKEEVNTLINFVRVQKEREERGIKTSSISYHCVFTGAPGTGKTTVARILSKIYKELGIVSKGHLIETDRAGLIAEFLGQTAVKVDKVVQSAIDGILFVDEAYSLVGENSDDYGKEAVATILKRMEDNRDRLAIIVAGYPEEMKEFIEENPGLKSRFNRFIHFEDYTPSDLVEIFKVFCKKEEYIVTKEAEIKLLSIFETLYKKRDKTFGNGRLARNIFEQCIENKSNRIAAIQESKLNRKILTTIEAVDIVDM